MLVDVDLVVKQVVEEDTPDTVLINQYIAAAYDTAADYLGLEIVDPGNLDPDLEIAENQIEESPAITQAILLLIGHFFENREDVVITAGSSSLKSIPMGFERLLQGKRKVGI